MIGKYFETVSRIMSFMSKLPPENILQKLSDC